MRLPVLLRVNRPADEAVPLPQQLDDVAAGIHRVRQGGVGLVLLAIAGSRRRGDRHPLHAIHRTAPGRASPTLVLAEQNNSDLTLQMLKMGVIDCLSQPLNTSRLGMLVDMFTLRSCPLCRAGRIGQE